MTVALSADLLEGFAGMFLSPRYDDPRPTAPFHRDAWALYCSDVPQAMVIAPRDHAKSTALTFDYVLAEALFKRSDYIIILGSTEEMAQEQLSNISDELHENDDLVREFGVVEFLTDSKTEIIVKLSDGHTFRILSRGAEQKIRGRLWKGKRPNLIVCDDIEDDEQVENKDRRSKFRRWFFRAARQALSKSGKIRVHGTILHEDSLLNRLKTNTAWVHLFYKAHESFDDFSNRLWPARWSEKELRAKRQEFIDDNDAAGYAQELLNDPLDNSDAYLRKDDFLPMTLEDKEITKKIDAAWDFAVSTSERADNTACVVGGKDVRNLIHILDCRAKKWNSLEIIEEMFMVQRAWNPQTHYVEAGVIWKSLSVMVFREMQRRDVWMNIVELPSVKDKATRGRTLQRHHRGRGMRFDKEASWYADYEFELLRFTESAKALKDDRFDATSLLARGMETNSDLEEDDFTPDEEFLMRRKDPRRETGRSAVTGY